MFLWGIAEKTSQLEYIVRSVLESGHNRRNHRGTKV
jgi:hypothetical protein